MKNNQTSFPYLYIVDIFKNLKITDNLTLFKNLIGLDTLDLLNAS